MINRVKSRVFLKVIQQVHHLRLNMGVQFRRRLVQDQQLRLQGKGHGDEAALVFTAAEFERIGPHDSVGVVEAEPAKDFAYLLVGNDGRFQQLFSDFHDRIQAGGGILRSIEDRSAAQFLQAGSLHDRLSLQTNAAADIENSRIEQPRNRLGQYRLPGARLADQRRNLAGVHRERNIPEQDIVPGLPANGNGQVLGFE